MNITSDITVPSFWSMDIEQLNACLEKKFREYDIRHFMSQRHPELFPDHIGLQSDDNMRLKIVRYTRGGLDECGEYIRDYDAAPIDNPEEYIANILEYYRDRDPGFYRFIANRIN